MNLSIKERMILLGMSADLTADILAIRELRKFREALSFSSEELKQHNIRGEGNSLVWDVVDEAIPKKLDVPERARELIIRGFESMDKKSSFTLDHIDIYERFIPPENEPEAEKPQDSEGEKTDG